MVALLANFSYAQIPVRLATETETEKTELEKVLKAKYTLLIRTDVQFGGLSRLYGGASCVIYGVTIKSMKDNTLIKGVYMKTSETISTKESYLDYSEIDGLIGFLRDAKAIFQDNSTNTNTIEQIYNTTSFNISVIRGLTKKDVIFMHHNVFVFDADGFINDLEKAKKWLDEQN